MIEAMTSGGFRRRGAVLAPADAFDDGAVVLPYALRFVERVERLEPRAAVRTAIGERRATHVGRARARGRRPTACTSPTEGRASRICPCGRYFEGLAADYAQRIVPTCWSSTCCAFATR